jgi:DNA invertase Pin-like site-specific DNA recombinase
LKARQRDGQAAKRAAGGHLGGSAKFGYRIEGSGKNATLVPVEHEQAAIRYAKQLRSQKMSLRAIAKDLEINYDVVVSHEAIRKATLEGEDK